jgi:carbon storage regulator
VVYSALNKSWIFLSRFPKYGSRFAKIFYGCPLLISGRSCLMLVLTRKIGEEIILDGSIRVRIVAVNGSRIRVAVDAPTEVQITRGELANRDTEALQNEQKA